MAEPIPFDLGMEILRGPAAALQMQARRTRLKLDSMPDLWPGLWDEVRQDDPRRLDAPTASD